MCDTVRKFWGAIFGRKTIFKPLPQYNCHDHRNRHDCSTFIIVHLGQPNSVYQALHRACKAADSSDLARTEDHSKNQQPWLPASVPVYIQSILFSHKHLFTFSICFILVRVAVNLDPVLGTLGMSLECALNLHLSAIQCSLSTYPYIFGWREETTWTRGENMTRHGYSKYLQLRIKPGTLVATSITMLHNPKVVKVFSN